MYAGMGKSSSILWEGILWCGCLGATYRPVSILHTHSVSPTNSLVCKSELSEKHFLVCHWCPIQAEEMFLCISPGKVQEILVYPTPV